MPDSASCQEPLPPQCLTCPAIEVSRDRDGNSIYSRPMRFARHLQHLLAILLCSFATACAVGSGDEQSGAIARGQALAESQCAQCHAIGPRGLSPYPAAPLWRELAETKDTDELAQMFGEGKLIHRDGTLSMPEYMLTPQQIGELVAYMKTLRAS